METRYTIRPREAASESIQAYILENQLCAGDRLPSEREMCSMWNLNRSTLRSALARFVRSGILEVRQGSGIFYIGPKYQRKLQGLKSFKAETMLQARAHESRLLSLEKLECDKRLSRVFQTILGTPLGICPGSGWPKAFRWRSKALIFWRTGFRGSTGMILSTILFIGSLKRNTGSYQPKETKQLQRPEPVQKPHCLQYLMRRRYSV